MNRRRFLQLAAGAGVATATMAEVGFFAEFMSWVKRSPKWFIPKTAGDYLTAAKIREAANALSGQSIQSNNAYIGVIHPFSVHELGPNILSHLSLRDLASVYYDKTAIDNLRRNMSFAEACQEIEASVLRTKNNRAGFVKSFVASEQCKIDHCTEERLSYTKNEKGEICALLAKNGKVELVPSTSLAYRNYNQKLGA